MTSASSSSLSPPAFPQLIPFDLPAVKEDPPQERPTANQTLAEVFTEQANLSVSAARSSKVLYVITTSPSHPPQTVPGSSSQTPSKRREPQSLGVVHLAVTETELSQVFLFPRWAGGPGSMTLFVLALEGHFLFSLIP